MAPLSAQLFEVAAFGFDTEAPGDPCAEEAGGHETDQQDRGAETVEKDGKEEGGEHGADFAD